MKDKVKRNVSLIEDETKREIASIVTNSLIFNGWNQAELSKKSGVSTGTISKIVNTGEASQINLFRVFNALGLIKTGEKPEQYEEKKTIINQLLKMILDSDDKDAIDMLEATLKKIKENLDMKEILKTIGQEFVKVNQEFGKVHEELKVLNDYLSLTDLQEKEMHYKSPQTNASQKQK